MVRGSVLLAVVLVFSLGFGLGLAPVWLFCSLWPSLRVGCMLVGLGSFFVVAGHVLFGVLVGALRLCSQKYFAFVGVLGRLLCLLVGVAWRLETAGRATWGGVVVCALCGWLCVLGGWAASPGQSW
jgi:hypothetical protein